MIYLDYSANTPSDPAVLEAFCRTEQQFFGNPNSTHSAGQAAQQEMARVSDSIAALLGVHPAEIIFTSGASESNNLALKGMAQAARHIGRHIISTPLEHSSVGGSLTALQNQGYEIDLLDIGGAELSIWNGCGSFCVRTPYWFRFVRWTANLAPCSPLRKLQKF